MAWAPPKTDWVTTDNYDETDLNRMEGNIHEIADIPSTSLELCQNEQTVSNIAPVNFSGLIQNNSKPVSYSVGFTRRERWGVSSLKIDYIETGNYIAGATVDFGSTARVFVVNEGDNSGEAFFTIPNRYTAITSDGENIIGVDNSTKDIFEHVGITSSRSLLFNSSGLGLLDITFDGTNLITLGTGGATNRTIRIHDGKTSTVTSSIELPDIASFLNPSSLPALENMKYKDGKLYFIIDRFCIGVFDYLGTEDFDYFFSLPKYFDGASTGEDPYLALAFIQDQLVLLGEFGGDGIRLFFLGDK